MPWPVSRREKLASPNEFWRVFQLGRIGGNFLIAFSATFVRMEDKQALLPAINGTSEDPRENTLKQVGSDKGYYSHSNVKAVQALPSIRWTTAAHDRKSPATTSVTQALSCRRAGIEPLIQHAQVLRWEKAK